MVHRVLLSLASKKLHDDAVAHAKLAHGTNFSGLVTKLIVEDLRRERELALAEKQRAKPTIDTIKATQDAEQAADADLSARLQNKSKRRRNGA